MDHTNLWLLFNKIQGESLIYAAVKQLNNNQNEKKKS